ncbi:MAG: hypothetical protein NTY07_12190 [Bacteroidia bacterium]|nr:hypothetical protein [Bacteroidia bacterium]
MNKIRITHPIDPKLNHNCDGIHISDYTMEEVILPSNKKEKSRKAISIVIKGRNFKAVAQPLLAFVGKIPVSFLRIAPDECSVEGVLLQEPKEETFVDVILGDQDHARHPVVFKKTMIKRI